MLRLKSLLNMLKLKVPFCACNRDDPSLHLKTKTRKTYTPYPDINKTNTTKAQETNDKEQEDKGEQKDKEQKNKGTQEDKEGTEGREQEGKEHEGREQEPRGRQAL
jgi:hypothetical protein